MAKLESLPKIREMIKQRMLDNLAAQSSGDGKELYNGLAMIEENTMWRLFQWVHNIILPKVLQNRGENSEEYKNYSEIRDSLMWCIYIMQQYEIVLAKRGQERQLLKWYQEQNAKMELELNKVSAMESVLNSDLSGEMRKIIVRKALDLLPTQKTENDG